MTKEQFIEQIAQVQEPLRRFLLVLCGGNGVLADDIAQEALLKAYLHFNDFAGRAKFSTWLFSIGYNCFYDSAQKESERRGAEISRDESPMPDIPDEKCRADKRYEYEPLYQAIDALTVQEKAVVLLFYMEDKPVKTIEQITGMPSGTIRSHLSRARAHLREYLDSKNL